jgi:hypothetical protein
MSELGQAAILLVILFASAAVGLFIRPLLPEKHRSREHVEIVQLIITMLVTFASLVMGLLTYSVKGSFDAASDDMAALAGQIVQLDHALREYGPETDTARGMLRSYTAAVIATTWPDEPPPPGNYYLKNARPISPGGMESLDLGNILSRIGITIHKLDPQDDFHRGLASDSHARLQDLIQSRWHVIEQAHPTISRPFFAVFVFWLAVIFASFGLVAPRSGFVIAMMALCAISIASAVFVILDMDTPFSGVIMISSQPMRNALVDISQ